MPKSSAMYLPRFVFVDGDEDVAQVHVGVEEAVAEDLVKKISTPAFDSAEVDAGGDERVLLADRHGPRMRSMTITVVVQWSQKTSGTSSSLSRREVAPQLRTVGRLAHQIRVRRADDLANSATTSRGFRRLPSDQTSSSPAMVSSKARSCADHAVHVRAQDLIWRLRATIPPDAGRAKCTCATELAPAPGRTRRTPRSPAGQRAARICCNACSGGNGGTRSEKPGQFVGNIERQQVAARRQHLSGT